MKLVTAINEEIRHRNAYIADIERVVGTITEMGAANVGARILNSVAELGWKLDAVNYFLRGVFDCAADEIPSDPVTTGDIESYRAAIYGVQRDLMAHSGGSAVGTSHYGEAYWKTLYAIQSNARLVVEG